MGRNLVRGEIGLYSLGLHVDRGSEEHSIRLNINVMGMGGQLGTTGKIIVSQINV